MTDFDYEEYIANLESQVDQLNKKNRTLQKENSKYKKQLASYNQVEMDERVREYLRARREEKEKNEEQAKLYEKWQCYECNGEGVLIIHQYRTSKRHLYYRECSHCDARTKSKVVHPKLEGVFANDLKK